MTGRPRTRPTTTRPTTTRAGAAGLLAAAAGQVGPGALWLPAVRERLWPSLASPMPPGTLAVTFDDGPHPAGTPAVLDALDAAGWPATFFVLTEHLIVHADLVREILARGHRLGLHGLEHRYLIARSPTATAADLRRAADTFTAVVGTRPRWWRPPYGVLSGPALWAAHRLGLRPVLWSAWGRDWTPTATPGSVLAEVCRGRLDGGTLLLHDSDATSAAGSWQTTAAALPLLAAHVRDLGLRVAHLPDVSAGDAAGCARSWRPRSRRRPDSCAGPAAARPPTTPAARA